MSRLIVKNLPSYTTPTLLKKHFSQSKGPKGTITDVKVVLKQDGAARRFGFVGFKTDEEASRAKEWYDKTFIDSTRVRVEIIDVGILSCLSRLPGLRSNHYVTRLTQERLLPSQTSGGVWIHHLRNMTLP